MSIATCDDGCGTHIDTDAYPESYVRVRRDNTIREECLCANCLEYAILCERVLPDLPSMHAQKSRAGFQAWENSAMKRQYRLGLFRQPRAV